MSLVQSLCFINGAWRPAASGATFAVTNPATGARVAEVPDAGAEETEQAIAAAEAAFPSWRARPASERAELLRALYEAVMENIEPLAELLTRENGKPLAESRGEVRYGAGFLQWFSEEARRVYGETIPGPSASRRVLVTREPVGVVALITPWNFPIAMITRKLGAALAAGCTVVCKPAEDTPLSALALAKLAEQVGLPPGVFNVVTGDAEAIGGALCASEVVRKLSFTGSTEVGRLLMEQCAPTLKRLSLELGGNAPFIVFDDADLDAAVEGAMASKYRNAGQTCVASNRFLVHEAVAEDFAARVAAASAALKVGDGLEDGVKIGPMINASGRDKVQRLSADAVDKGAQVHLASGEAEGLFLSPCVLSGLSDEMDLWHEEVFGPLIAVRAFSSEAEALALANDTPWGLAAYLYTRDNARVFRMSEGLEFGMVGVNTGMISTPVAPFGGVKQSGFGREGSRHGLDEYLQLKYTAIELG